MKVKYKIMCLAALLLFTTLIGAGYQYSYRYAQKQQETSDAVIPEPQSVSAQGEAEAKVTAEEGYILSHLHGFVVVYYADGQTIYEVTDIELTSLPEEVQGEITEGKHIKDVRELYGFLENYSS